MQPHTDSAVATRSRRDRARSRSPAAIRQRKLRANRKAGQHHYGMWLSDRVVEGMPARPRTVSGRLISLRHRPSTAAATPCSAPPRRRPKPDRLRALELLATSRDRATEALMIAHGFTPPRGCEFAHLKDSLAGRSSCLSAI